MKRTLRCVWCIWWIGGASWLSLPAWPVLAQETAEDWDALRQQVQELRTQARQIRADAARRHEAAARACWEKVLVSACQQDARAAQRETEKEARQLEQQAMTLERRIAAHDRAERLARKAEKLRERDRKAVERAGQIRLDDEAHRLRVEKKQAEIDRKTGKAGKGESLPE